MEESPPTPVRPSPVAKKRPAPGTTSETPMNRARSTPAGKKIPSMKHGMSTPSQSKKPSARKTPMSHNRRGSSSAHREMQRWQSQPPTPVHPAVPMANPNGALQPSGDGPLQTYLRDAGGDADPEVVGLLLGEKKSERQDLLEDNKDRRKHEERMRVQDQKLGELQLLHTMEENRKDTSARLQHYSKGHDDSEEDVELPIEEVDGPPLDSDDAEETQEAFDEEGREEETSAIGEDDGGTKDFGSRKEPPRFSHGAKASTKKKVVVNEGILADGGQLLDEEMPVGHHVSSAPKPSAKPSGHKTKKQGVVRDGTAVAEPPATEAQVGGGNALDETTFLPMPRFLANQAAAYVANIENDQSKAQKEKEKALKYAAQERVEAEKESFSFVRPRKEVPLADVVCDTVAERMSREDKTKFSDGVFPSALKENEVLHFTFKNSVGEQSVLYLYTEFFHDASAEDSELSLEQYQKILGTVNSVDVTFSGSAEGVEVFVYILSAEEEALTMFRTHCSMAAVRLADAHLRITVDSVHFGSPSSEQAVTFRVNVDSLRKLVQRGPKMVAFTKASFEHLEQRYLATAKATLSFRECDFSDGASHLANTTDLVVAKKVTKEDFVPKHFVLQETVPQGMLRKGLPFLLQPLVDGLASLTFKEVEFSGSVAADLLNFLGAVEKETFGKSWKSLRFEQCNFSSSAESTLLEETEDEDSGDLGRIVQFGRAKGGLALVFNRCHVGTTQFSSDSKGDLKVEEETPDQGDDEKVEAQPFVWPPKQGHDDEATDDAPQFVRSEATSDGSGSATASLDIWAIANDPETKKKSWKCACTTQNSISADTCVACNQPKPAAEEPQGSLDNLSSSVASAVAAGSWEESTGASAESMKNDVVLQEDCGAHTSSPEGKKAVAAPSRRRTRSTRSSAAAREPLSPLAEGLPNKTKKKKGSTRHPH